jgi:hypothetical protein
MMEVESPQDAYKDLTPETYQNPIDVAVGNFGNPYDDMLENLQEMTVQLQRIANFSERQREKVAPTIVDLSPGTGSQVASTYTTKTSLRILGILMSGGNGDKFAFKVGALTLVNVFASTTGAAVYFPFPYTCKAGNDLSVADLTNPSSLAWTFVVFAYPE